MTVAAADIQTRAAMFRDCFGQLQTEIGRVFVGQSSVVEQLLLCFFCQGHALIEGPPGLGKTLLVRTLSDALNLQLARVQCTPDLMPADITGTQILMETHDGVRSFAFQRGPIFANIVLADEINRATPKTQSALLEAMAEQQVTVAGKTYPLAPPFFVLATLNPIEMEGTYQLPEAQLDRFLFKVVLDYPSEPELERILGTTTGAELATVTPVFSRDGAATRVEHLKRLVRQVLVAPHIERYVAALVRLTASEETAARHVMYGSSPRGGQALILGAKVLALLDGRPHVTADDVERVALPAFRHRLVLNFAAGAAGVGGDEVIGRVLTAARRVRP